MKKFRLLVILISGLMFISNVLAESTNVVLNKDYTIIATDISKKSEPNGVINVKEFFNFACIHCKDVDPLVEATLANDKTIDLEKIQTVWGNDQTLAGFAKLNATFAALKLSKLYTPAFNAIFANQNLNDTNVLRVFLKNNGFNDSQITSFMNTYNSFDISTQAGMYKSMTSSYNITGTPTFIIADKYIANPAQPEKLIQVVRALVEKAKKESKRK